MTALLSLVAFLYCLVGLGVWMLLLLQMLNDDDFLGALITFLCGGLVMVFWPALAGQLFKRTSQQTIDDKI